MVFVGEGSTKKRHDPVAHHLIDRALVVVDRVDHMLEDRVEELSCLLRITIGHELHGSLEVSEENGDLLAFAVEGSL
jgi:hypothetical protein